MSKSYCWGSAFCVPLQPQSTDFTQYNSYSDMCGGGRGESCNPKTRNARAILFTSISPETYSASASLLVHKWTRPLVRVHIDSRGGQGQQCCLVGARRQFWPRKPLTVSLIFCPMLSCRVSGMSLICFSTWHAAASPCTTYFACPWVRKTHLTLECTLSTPATCLQHCWFQCQLQGVRRSTLQACKTRTAQ